MNFNRNFKITIPVSSFSFIHHAFYSRNVIYFYLLANKYPQCYFCYYNQCHPSSTKVFRHFNNKSIDINTYILVTRIPFIWLLYIESLHGFKDRLYQLRAMVPKRWGVPHRCGGRGYFKI